MGCAPRRRVRLNCQTFRSRCTALNLSAIGQNLVERFAQAVRVQNLLNENSVGVRDDDQSRVREGRLDLKECGLEERVDRDLSGRVPYFFDGHSTFCQGVQGVVHEGGPAPPGVVELCQTLSECIGASATPHGQRNGRIWYG